MRAGAVEWQGYRLGCVATVNERLSHARSIDRSEARSEFTAFISAIPARIDELTGLVLRNGLSLDSSDRGLGLLGEWISRRAADDPDNAQRLSRAWTSAAYDVGIYLGESLVTRSDGVIKWSLYTKRKLDLSFQQPVLMGFRHAPTDGHHIDPLALCLSFVVSVARGEHRWDRLVRIAEAVSADF